MVPHTYQMNRGLLLAQGGLLANLDLPDMERTAQINGKSADEIAMIRAAIEFSRACTGLTKKGATP